MGPTARKDREEFKNNGLDRMRLALAQSSTSKLVDRKKLASFVKNINNSAERGRIETELKTVRAICHRLGIKTLRDALLKFFDCGGETQLADSGSPDLVKST